MRHASAGLALWLASCAPIAEESNGLDGMPAAFSRSAIYGGTTNTQDPQVFMLTMFFPNGQQGACTATLIAPRTLLTAAHCVDPRIENQTRMEIWAHNKTSISATNQSDYVQIVETRMHPGWSPNNPQLGNDIALARLARASSVTPKPWNSASVNSFQGKPLRALGYGLANSNPNSSGTRREVNLTFAQVTPALIFLGDQNGKGVCSGDSGGPSFHTFSDGVERVVGVHSFTATTDCDFGADSRVDIYASFINQWLTEKEAPTCQADGRCKTGCTPIDQDCACLDDGICDPQCLDLSKDPDCPKDCIANGVCSTLPCPVADVDCVNTGDTCTSELQCESRLCVADAQSMGFYCTLECAGGLPCPEGMQCSSQNGLCGFNQRTSRNPGEACQPIVDFCTERTVCTGKEGEPTRCELPCTSVDDCPAGASCESGQNRTNYCKLPPQEPIQLNLAQGVGPSAPSCSSTGGVPLSLGLLAFLMWAGRRRPTHLRE